MELDIPKLAAACNIYERCRDELDKEAEERCGDDMVCKIRVFLDDEENHCDQDKPMPNGAYDRCVAGARNARDQGSERAKGCTDDMTLALGVSVDQMFDQIMQRAAMELFALKFRFFDKENPVTGEECSRYMKKVQSFFTTSMDAEILQKLGVKDKSGFMRTYVQEPLNFLMENDPENSCIAGLKIFAKLADVLTR